MINPTLWHKINNFKIGSGNEALSFEKRLARENGWTLAYTHKVMGEYRRFIYLASVSNQDITLSDQVDQAWHLHMLYTQSYWEGLCRETLERSLHHKPTEGGAKERERFIQQYTDTLKFYQQEFNEKAPETIWPPTQKRFADNADFVRINRKQQWLIPKPKQLIEKVYLFLLLPLLLTACTQNLSEKDIWFWVKVIVGSFVALKVIQWLVSNNKGGGSGGGGNNCGSGCGSSCGGGCGS